MLRVLSLKLVAHRYHTFIISGIIKTVGDEKACFSMEDKFELIEDFQSPKRSRSSDVEMVQITLQEVKDDNDTQGADWRPQFYKASEHPVQLMVHGAVWSHIPMIFFFLKRWILIERIF